MRWHDPTNWDLGVTGKDNKAVFENTNGETPIVIEGITEVEHILLRLPRKTHRLTIAGSGSLVLHGAESRIRNKYFAGLIETGILDFGPDLHVDIHNQRLIAQNKDGTIVIRSNRVRAGKKTPTTNNYPSDGKDLKLDIADRGRFFLATAHWEPGMFAGHTVGFKIFEFALKEGSQGVTFTRLKKHDGDPVEIHGFDAEDFFCFQEDPFQLCD